MQIDFEWTSTSFSTSYTLSNVALHEDAPVIKLEIIDNLHEKNKCKNGIHYKSSDCGEGNDRKLIEVKDSEILQKEVKNL